ncbi:MAG: glycosyltransferase [Saprospiraceae bacterium]
MLTDKPRRILLIGPAYPFRGGLAAFNERLAMALQARGHEVEIITFTVQYPGFLFPGKTQFSNDPPPSGLKITRLVHTFNPFNWLRAAWIMRRRQADVWIVAFWLPLLGPCLGSLLRLSEKAKVKRIGLIHNIIPHEKRPGDLPFAHYFARACDGFMTLSDSVRDALATFSQAPVAVAPHPIYDSYGALLSKAEARTHLRLDATAKYLLFFGFIRAYKGLDWLLQAMADERVRQLGVKLIVAGEYYGNQLEYERLIQTYGVADQLVMHTEFIANEEVRYYFCAADVVVQPYKTATQSGISQLAYHFEKPMIVTAVGGLPEIVPDGEAGLVVESSPTAIADAIVDFYTNQRESSLQKGVQTRKQQYSWQGFVAEMERLF